MGFLKRHIKQWLVKSGLWHVFNSARSIPRTYRWIRSGCRGPAPHPIKMRIIKAYLEHFELNNFVETGTYRGDTLDFIAKTGAHCTSIELSDELYEAASVRFSGRENIILTHGDSGEKLPSILADVFMPALFWLDGHYSAGATAMATEHTPISKELSAILSHPIKSHVVLIDDARCFNGTNDYPHLDELLRVVREDGNYSAEVSADIIRLIPRVYTA